MSGVVLTEEFIKKKSCQFDVEIVSQLEARNLGIKKIQALNNCINLVDLDLSYNEIDKMEGLSDCKSLKRLNLSCNRISRIEGLEGLVNLEYLAIQGNLIKSYDDLTPLAKLPKLWALYLRNLSGEHKNPVCSDPSYRSTMAARFPNLVSLDGERLQQQKAIVGNVDTISIRGTPAAAETAVDEDISDLIPESRPWTEGFKWDSLQPTETQLKVDTAAFDSLLRQCSQLCSIATQSIQSASASLAMGKKT